MQVFHEGIRTDPAPRGHRESNYDFLNRVAGPYWDACRELILDWLLQLPPDARAPVQGRITSGNERNFRSAFWELYLHEMYRRDGWSVQFEPPVPASSKRPDFLFTKDGESLYVEARCVFDNSDGGAGARLAGVHEAIDKIDSGPFHLAVQTKVIGKRTPPTGPLRQALEDWLERLDPDNTPLTLGDEDPNGFVWVHDDWRIAFHAIARAREVREQRAERPIGLWMPAGAEFVDDIGALRAALSDKGNKYGPLDRPLVLAVDIVRGFHSHRDTVQALYGTVGFSINLEVPEQEARPVIVKPGYFGIVAANPRHPNVAGVLLMEGLTYANVGQVVPAYYRNLSAPANATALPTWSVIDIENSTLNSAEAAPPQVAPSVHFALPVNWPPGEPFPRRLQGQARPALEA